MNSLSRLTRNYPMKDKTFILVAIGAMHLFQSKASACAEFGVVSNSPFILVQYIENVS